MTFTHSICVFCGSRSGNDPRFAQDARETGAMIAQEGWRLVFGAGDIGLMG
ncbi:MAG: TIGR00730 family Rossman fold protein, partial [Rhodobacter sp.]